MKFRDTQASQAKWSSDVEEALDLDSNDISIVFDDANIDYSGSAEIVAIRFNSEVIHYSWTYGSCSGCDSWEDLDSEIRQDEIRKTAAYLSKENYRQYFKGRLDIITILDQFFKDKEAIKVGRFADLED